MKSAFFAVNKPRGISSAMVTNKVKWLYRQTGQKVKVGNMGTLDVDASGVLVIALEKATRMFQYYSVIPKTYETIIKFGVETDTLDSTGTVLKTSEKIPSIKELNECLSSFIGTQMQLPPKYSAKKVNGERAYNIMRNNSDVDFELKPKEIKIYDIKLIEQVDEELFKFEITCSTGTYIRSIARDIAKYNTTYGITTSIIRTKSSIFTLEHALNFETLNIDVINKNLCSLNEVVHFDVIKLSKEDNRKLLNVIKLETYFKTGFYYIMVEDELTMLVESANNKLNIVLNLEEKIDG